MLYKRRHQSSQGHRMSAMFQPLDTSVIEFKQSSSRRLTVLRGWVIECQQSWLFFLTPTLGLVSHWAVSGERSRVTTDWDKIGADRTILGLHEISCRLVENPRCIPFRSNLFHFRPNLTLIAHAGNMVQGCQIRLKLGQFNTKFHREDWSLYL